jgi:hypothetical protein
MNQRWEKILMFHNLKKNIQSMERKGSDKWQKILMTKTILFSDIMIMEKK